MTEQVFVADVLVDGSGAAAVEQPALVVADGRIASVARRTPTWRPPRDATVVDCSGCSLLPGLIDAHVHLALPADRSNDAIISFCETASDEELLEVMRAQAEEALRAGQTTLRDCGAPRRTALAARAACASGDWLGPRLLVAGPPITTERGHCYWMGLAARGEDELRRAVCELVESGVDFVKVMATGGMMTAGSDPYRPQYSLGELTALVEEAHLHDRRVAAHVLSALAFRDVLAAGVDTIEHGWTITGRRQDVDEALAAEAAVRPAIGSVTAHHALRTLLRDGDLEELRRRLAWHRRFRDRGFRLVVHSDAGPSGTAFGDFASSVEVFMQGLETTVEEAVAAATSLPAQALGIEHERGTVAVGLAADLVAVEGHLPGDIRALRCVRWVVRDGRTVVES